VSALYLAPSRFSLHGTGYLDSNLADVFEGACDRVHRIALSFMSGIGASSGDWLHWIRTPKPYTLDRKGLIRVKGFSGFLKRLLGFQPENLHPKGQQHPHKAGPCAAR
jgi:hypothetical protein